MGGCEILGARHCHKFGCQLADPGQTLNLHMLLPQSIVKAQAEQSGPPRTCLGSSLLGHLDHATYPFDQRGQVKDVRGGTRARTELWVPVGRNSQRRLDMGVRLLAPHCRHVGRPSLCTRVPPPGGSCANFACFGESPVLKNTGHTRHRHCKKYACVRLRQKSQSRI